MSTEAIDQSIAFYKVIESIVNKYNITFLEAIAHHCETNNIEIENLSAVINKNPKLKAQIQSEGEDMNLLPKTSRLPI